MTVSNDMGRLKHEEWERRVARAEELLIEKSSSRAVVGALTAEFDVGSSSAWRYVKAARERREAELAQMDTEAREVREAARDRVRRTLLHVQSIGFATKQYALVLRACRQLRHLDALDEPNVRVADAVNTTSRFDGASTEDLIAFLRSGRLPH